MALGRPSRAYFEEQVRQAARGTTAPGQRVTYTVPGNPGSPRDMEDAPDAILTATQWQIYASPTRAAVMAMDMD
jgi:hypothetical protein